MIRVRGIHSTAIAGLLDEAGFRFADLSQELLARIPQLRVEERVLVTVKDTDDRSGVVVLGDRAVVEKVAYLLRAVIPGALVSYVGEGPYTTYAVRLLSRVEGDVYEAEYSPGKRTTVKLRRPHVEGEVIMAHVIRASPEAPLLKEGVAITGSLVRLVQFDRHSVSEHIRDENLRLQLLTLAMTSAPTGWGVHFRSASKRASIVDVMAEIKALSEKAEKILKEVAPKEPGVVVPGEAIAIVEIPADASIRMDALRSRYYPTLPLHHLLKRLGDDELSRAVDFSERLLAGCEKCLSSTGAIEVFLERLSSLKGRQVSVLHRKVAGAGHVWSAEVESVKRMTVVLKRVVSSPGLYDGFEGLKREPGDVIRSYTWLFGRAVVHFYTSARGELKGVYVNINAPVFFAGNANTLGYVDLGVDVTRAADEEPKVVDLAEFLDLVERGVLDKQLAGSYLEFAESVKHLLEKDIGEDLPARIMQAQKSIFSFETDKLLAV
ncbi:ribonuclease FAU-1 family protein [Thermofilum pendens]|uniref:Probable ribonuclease FAU-1 n=1 Tax=Thermofilum pendens (strain DSM 2475 / Hrk 5) TaxID=368408 RepID=FAU1_THEPD|nr:DUF402 domain-containing protein [Thermofilum pendens]A1RXN7.1 RecName: Full=Probable ribonuclease FAU-1; AltName: Full=RNA-binding protein FAU-1 [Thermofilum pendens Hrk 5]ABL77967.1 protein of unknown function DUF402 [Thermofilum pendens Hrk 5]